MKTYNYYYCEDCKRIHTLEELKEEKYKEPHGEITVYYHCPHCNSEEVREFDYTELETFEEFIKICENSGINEEEFKDYQNILEYFEEIEG